MTHANNSGNFGFKKYSLNELRDFKKVCLANLKKKKLERQQGADNGNILMAAEERVFQLEHEIFLKSSCQ